MPPEPAVAPRRPRLNRTAVHVCVCAFLMQFKPSEPHLVPYLVDVKGFTNKQVNSDIFPVSLYASLVFFIVAGPAASLTSTKTVLVAGGACKLLTRVLLLWGRTLADMRLMQVAFAAGSASDLMLYAYVAAVTRKAASGRAQEHGAGATIDADTPSVASTHESEVRFVTGAVSAAALLGYMVAAEFGQVAFERGASYESLFYVSLVSICLGCVGIASLPSDRTSAPDDGARRSTSFSFFFKRLFSRDSAPGDRRRDPAARSTVVSALESCYGSTASIALSLWWAVGTPPSTILETYVLSLLEEIGTATAARGAEGDRVKNDLGGHVVFFSRALSATASLLATRATSKQAEAPETYIVASVVIAACACVFSISESVFTAASFYAAAVAASHGISVLAFSQTTSCADAAARGFQTRQYARLEETSSGSSEDGVAAGRTERAPDVDRNREDESRRNGPDDGLVFGVNGALALIVLVVLQAAIDAAGVDVRGAAAAAAVTSALAALLVLCAASFRRGVARTEWGFVATPPDVSYEWLRSFEKRVEGWGGVGGN